MRELKLRFHVALNIMLYRRTPPGVRELKLVLLALMVLSRTPPGVRELKLYIFTSVLFVAMSHPSRGA